MLRKATLKGNCDDIPITVFAELVYKLKEPSTLILTDFRISKYMTTKLLKSTELLTIQKAKRKVIIDTDDIIDSNHGQVTSEILSFELDSLNEKIFCTKCEWNGELLDEELVICNSCNTMTTEDSCKKLENVIFTPLVNG